MRHAGVSDREAMRRRAAVLEQLRAGERAAAVAGAHGISERYVLMIARDAGIARPQGRPIGSTKQPKPRPAPSRRGGYALQPVERGAVL